MILKNRLFQRAKPSRNAKVFYIFCEGRSREYDYFNYFRELDSRISLEIIKPETDDNNSPEGLYLKACSFIIKTEQNPSPKYELLDFDEVWFVIDTDKWGNKIDNLRSNCKANKDHSEWHVAQSNPCFEVWLYYHIKEDKPIFDNIDISKEWKSFVNNAIAGGFDSRKHPIFIGRAINNAKNNHSEKNGKIEIACTEVFKLAENIFPFIESKIEEGLKQIENKQ
ncbi:RloB family protein [Bacteroidales bacterium OttesenSCG-928-I14]|nr:RloB family protein [Bacteroidales bacterium OttesenSCG-928-I14]